VRRAPPARPYGTFRGARAGNGCSGSLSAGTGTSIVAAASGLTFNALSTARNVALDGCNYAIQFGAQISAPISGGGNAGVTMTGPGNICLLGGAPGAGVANIYVAAAPALVGGGGAAGSTRISIIPYAIGNTAADTTLLSNGVLATSFVTYGANGVRPLSTAEYATTFGLNSADNVRVSAVTTAPSATVNSLLVAANAESTIAAPFLSGGTINATSGAVMYSPTVDKAGVIAANLNFGSAEGVITNTSTLTLNGVISGSGGLTLSSAYAATNQFTPSLTLLRDNTYTGDTTINSSAIGFSGTVGNGVAGAFGTGGTIILNGGINLAALVTTGNTTFDRDIRVIGSGKNFLTQASGGGGILSTFNGNIQLDANLVIEGRTPAAANAMTFNGTISGAGTAPRTLVNDILMNAPGGFAGTVQDGSLTKAGNGAIALNSPTGNSFSAGFVNTGVAATASAIYANNSSGSAFGAGAVSIGATSAVVYSTLAGNFSTAGDTRIAGRLSPSPGAQRGQRPPAAPDPAAHPRRVVGGRCWPRA
jgi:hypothetical protein